MARCTNCHKFTEIVTTTVTGRRLCQDCSDDLQSAAAGIMMAGGSGNAVPDAVAVRGWLKRMRRARGKDKDPG